jgi:hypothetical protein
MAKHNNNFFIITFKWVNKLNWGISEEGSLKLVHQRRNENTNRILFFITYG